MPRFTLKTLLSAAAVVPLAIYYLAIHIRWTHSFGSRIVVLRANEPAMDVGQTSWRLIMGVAGGCLVACLYFLRQRANHPSIGASSQPMTAYLPRFTLRRALIAIGLLALFLGWLRLDRAVILNTPRMRGYVFQPPCHGIMFFPMWPECQVEFSRSETIDASATYDAQIKFGKPSKRPLMFLDHS